jgi:ferredoxin--NADP+ reductase
LFRIVEKRQMANDTVCHFQIQAPLIAKKAKPGQFVVLRPTETGARGSMPAAISQNRPGLGNPGHGCGEETRPRPYMSI